MTEEALRAAVGEGLAAAGLTVGLAESCTGGLVSSQMTDLPGSSAYLLGAIVAYSYQAREQLLGVRRETCMAFGAVSEEVALEMARGARRAFHSHLGVAVTGIAGPGGGTPDKPVGLAYIALSAADAELCERHVWQGDSRIENRYRSAGAAFRLISFYLNKPDRCDE